MQSDVPSAAFDQAVEYVRTLPRDGPVVVSNADKLQLYGWYKRVTAGATLPDRPGMLAFEAKAKWDAWDAVKGMSVEEAAAAYVEKVQLLKAEE